MIAQAVRDLLVADSTVTAGLATYDFGGVAAEPAVFTIDPAPGDCAQPLVVVTAADGAYWGTRGQKGAQVWATVRVWGDKGRSDLALNALAWSIWRCLDRAEPVATGWELSTMHATPPARVTDTDGFPGYLVRVSALALDTT